MDHLPLSNQIVHVKWPEGVVVRDRTTVLQVTGALQQRQTKTVTFGPGSIMEVVAEYAIEPTEIKVVDLQANSLSRR